jgi:uncharacterized membrane protein YgdD (TMEM256/DUF423 family)
MTIRCVGCGRAIRIPDEKAENPRLKVKCTCGVVFALAEAMEAAADSAAAERAVIAPASLTPVDMALTIDPSLTQPVEPIAPAAEPAAPAPQPRRTRPPGGWRRCINHHTEPSTYVCPKCTVGYCAACETTVRESTVICPVCEAFCVPVKKYEEGQELVRQRQRSMMEELQTIATYPLRDPMAYAMLAVFSGFFALGARLGGMLWVIGTILSMGALYGYCFYALNRVASGNLKDFMPPIGDFWEFVEPCKLGLAAFLASTGPLLLIVTWAGFSVAKSFMADAPAPIEMSVVHAQVASEAEEATPQLSGGAMLLATLLLIPAILWKIAYTPVALTVAALSRSVLSILNPMVALDTVKRMGIVYWQAMLIYAVLAFGQWVLNFLLSFIPYLGAVVASFVDAYIYLAIGCTLGLAVFKKAPELGFD